MNSCLAEIAVNYKFKSKFTGAVKIVTWCVYHQLQAEQCKYGDSTSPRAQPTEVANGCHSSSNKTTKGPETLFKRLSNMLQGEVSNNSWSDCPWHIRDPNSKNCTAGHHCPALVLLIAVLIRGYCTTLEVLSTQVRELQEGMNVPHKREGK